MMRSKYLSLVAACAALSVGSVCFAGDLTGLPGTTPPAPAVTPLLLDDTTMPMGMGSSPNKDIPPADAPPSDTDRNLLMLGFDKLGVGKAMSDAHLSLGGYVEGSWTYDLRPQDGNVIGGRIFDSKNESFQFDSVDLAFRRQWDPTYKHFDFGFDIETMYGWDSAFLHSNGISIYSPGRTASPIPGAGNSLTIHPKAQFDLTQAFGYFALPVGTGLGIEFGKFDTLLGYEVIDANASEMPDHPVTFFSRSFIFQEEPFTHTGALAVYNFLDPSGNDKLVLTGGITRGWNQATRDNNGSIDYTGQLKYVTKGYSLKFSGITGQEESTPAFGTVGLSGYRTVFDLDGEYKIADNLKIAADVMYAFENQTSEGGNGGGIGQWYAAAAYLSYQPTSIVTINLRGEWFDDQDGAAPVEYLTGGYNPTYGKAIGTANEYFEATFGLNITPFAASKELRGLHIRPEFRWDYSDHAAWNGGTQHDQWSASVEAYFTF